MSSAGLPEGQELERLSQALHKQGQEAIYHCTNLQQAWVALDARYGDPGLIAERLKRSLKEYRPPQGDEHEQVIALVDKVNEYVTRIRELGYEDGLRYDTEFRGTIFRNLPGQEQREWTRRNPEPNTTEWDAFMMFLNDSQQQAFRTRRQFAALGGEPGQPPRPRAKSSSSIVCYNCQEEGHFSHNCRKSPTSRPRASTLAAATSEQQTFSHEKARTRAGKCPVCQEEHTYTRRNSFSQCNEEFPTDQLNSCPVFRNLPPEERGHHVERVKGCYKCTAWTHQARECGRRARNEKCQEMNNGQPCGKAHNHLLHRSNTAYCLDA